MKPSVVVALALISSSVFAQGIRVEVTPRGGVPRPAPRIDPLMVCQNDLASMNASLAQCNGNLGNANNQLTSLSAQNQTLSNQLAQLQAQYDGLLQENQDLRNRHHPRPAPMLNTIAWASCLTTGGQPELKQRALCEGPSQEIASQNALRALSQKFRCMFGTTIVQAEPDVGQPMSCRASCTGPDRQRWSHQDAKIQAGRNTTEASVLAIGEAVNSDANRCFFAAIIDNCRPVQVAVPGQQVQPRPRQNNNGQIGIGLTFGN